MNVPVDEAREMMGEIGGRGMGYLFENMDKIDNVLFNNCIIKNSNRGIGIQNRDEGTVSKSFSPIY